MEKHCSSWPWNFIRLHLFLACGELCHQTPSQGTREPGAHEDSATSGLAPTGYAVPCRLTLICAVPSSPPPPPWVISTVIKLSQVLPSPPGVVFWNALPPPMRVGRGEKGLSEFKAPTLLCYCHLYTRP